MTEFSWLSAAASVAGFAARLRDSGSSGSESLELSSSDDESESEDSDEESEELDVEQDVHVLVPNQKEKKNMKGWVISYIIQNLFVKLNYIPVFHDFFF